MAARGARSTLGLLTCIAAMAGSVAAQAPPGVARPPAVDFSVRRYVVDEADLSAVVERLNTMRLEGPTGRLSQGLTEYHIRPEWTPAASRGTCRVGRMQLHVEIVVTLPDWPGAARATATDRERWERILGAIREHELAHRDLTIEAAREITSVLSGLEAGGCLNLRRAVAGTLSIHGGRLEEAHAELDAKTPDRLIG